LFAVFQHPVGTPVDCNPGLIAVAERTRDLPGIKRGKDYFFHARKILEAGNIQVSFPKDCYTERLAGVEFDVMELEMVIAGKTIRQKTMQLSKRVTPCPLLCPSKVMRKLLRSN